MTVYFTAIEWMMSGVHFDKFGSSWWARGLLLEGLEGDSGVNVGWNWFGGHCKILSVHHRGELLIWDVDLGRHRVMGDPLVFRVCFRRLEMGGCEFVCRT